MINILAIPTEKYASCVDASKRVRWDIDRDIIRGRDFEMDQKLLPDSISGIQRFEFLDPREARLLSQIQGRTLREHVRSGGTLHQLQDSGTEPTSLDWRSSGAGGAGAL